MNTNVAPKTYDKNNNNPMLIYFAKLALCDVNISFSPQNN